MISLEGLEVPSLKKIQAKRASNRCSEERDPLLQTPGYNDIQTTCYFLCSKFLRIIFVEISKRGNFIYNNSIIIL